MPAASSKLTERSRDVEQRGWAGHRYPGQGLQPDLVRRAVPEQRAAPGDLRPGCGPGRRLGTRGVLPSCPSREQEGRRPGQVHVGQEAFRLTLYGRRQKATVNRGGQGTLTSALCAQGEGLAQ